MEKERRVKALSIVALLITIVGLTVAFAAMSRTLTINGTATMDTARWNIHFANITNNAIHAATVNSAQITSETSITYGVTLTKPGDKAEIEFDVVNEGDIDAYIGGLDIFTINCENETGDRNIVCSNLEWSLKYKETGNTNNVAVNDTLTAGQTRHMIYEIGYKESATTLPENDVTFNDLTITITYNQDMGNATTSQVTMSQDSIGEEVIGGPTSNVLTYPLSGTLDNGVTYRLTSNGRLVLGGLSSISDEYNDSSLARLIAEDILGDSESIIYEDLRNFISDGENSYSDAYEEYSSMSDEDFMADFEMTKSEFLQEFSRLQNIVTVTTIEFAQEVNTVTLVDTVSYGFGEFRAITEIDFKSREVSYPSEKWRNENIHVTRPDID